MSIQIATEDSSSALPIAELDENPFVRIFTKRVIMDQHPERSSVERVWCLLKWGGGMSIAYIGAIPYLNAAFQNAGNPSFHYDGEPGNYAYGCVLAGSEFIDTGTLNAWAMHGILFDVTDGFSSEEKKEFYSSGELTAKFIIRTTALGIALISRIPSAYVAYYYNKYRIVMACINLFANAIIPTRSLMMGAEDFYHKKKFSEIEAKLSDSRSIICNFLSKNRAQLIVNATIRNDQLESFENLIKEPNTGHKFIQFFEQALGDIHVEEKPKSLVNKSVTNLGNGVGVFFSITQLMLFVVLGYQAGILIWDEPIFGGSIGLLSAGCSAYLMTIGCMYSTSGYANSLYQIASNQALPTNPARFCMPKLLILAEFLVLVINAFGYGAYNQIVVDNFTGALRLFMQITTISGIIVLISYIALDIVQQGVEIGIRNYGKHEHRQLLKYLNQIEQLEKLLKSYSLPNYAKLLSTALPHSSVLSEIVAKANLDSENLNDYNSERNESTSLIDYDSI